MSQVKSVFLYGRPTKIKTERLFETQQAYTDLINVFIRKLASDEKYYLEIFNNNKHAPSIRELEKEIRPTHKLGSAYGQNAIDQAMKEVHNHFIRIRNNVYGYIRNKEAELVPYISYLSLLNASIRDIDELDVLDRLLSTRMSKKAKRAYESLRIDLSTLTEEQRFSNKEYIRTLFLEKLDYWKLPFVNKATIQLDSRVATIENSKDTKEDFVVSVKLVNEKKRVQFPVSTSENGLRRMNQYKTGSLSMTLIDGKVKFGVPITKKLKHKKQTEMIGVDMGITDLLYTSTNQHYGTFTGMVNQYEASLERKLGHRSSLRNKRKEYKKRLESTTDCQEKEFLRSKIQNISASLNGRKSLGRSRRRYNHMVDVQINLAAKGLFEEIKKSNAIPVFEKLEITTFNRGKKSNKRDSSWVRGKLIKKITGLLDWHGFDYRFVEPAYTSKTCNRCSNVNDENRKGKIFTCTVCKYKADADHNASINIRDRVHDKELERTIELYPFQTKKRHKALKELLYDRHCNYMKKIS